MIEIEGLRIAVDVAAKFFGSLRVSGTMTCASPIRSIALIGPGILSSHFVRDEGTDAFEVQCLRDRHDDIPAALALEVTVRDGRLKNRRVAVPVTQIIDNAFSERSTWRPGHRFQDYLNGIDRPKILDIGGRNRSGTSQGDLYPNTDYTVLDIQPSDNVDVVGDAHQASRYFPRDHFDAVISTSVFEHILMPWRVVLEINRVLKPGGLAMIYTHQCLGMHDMPWDFWRFSTDAWDALFNAKTGFEIVDREHLFPQFVIPHVCNKPRDAEKASGFESSSVLARKVGDTMLEWPVDVADAVATKYPSNA